MKQDIVNLANSPWIGTFLGIVSLVAAIYFYIRSKRFKQLAYQQHNTTLIGKSDARFPEQIQIIFENIIVPRVTATRIVIWNTGTETILGENIAQTDPLRFDVSGNGKILQASIVKHTRTVNAANLDISNQRANIFFDFFDPGDGISIEIIHSSSEIDGKLTGTIRGIPHGPIDFGKIPPFGLIVNEDRLSRMINNRRTPYFMMLFGIFLALGGYFYPKIMAIFPNESSSITRWTVIGLGLIYTATSVHDIWLNRKRYPSQLSFESIE